MENSQKKCRTARVAEIAAPIAAPKLAIVTEDRRLLLGAHLSIAGGVDKAIDHARSLGCTVLQLFTHNPRQWAVKGIDEATAMRFRQKQSDARIITLAHTSYLINLVSNDPEVRTKSFALLIDEMRLARTLGIPFVILHPGKVGSPVDDRIITEFAQTLDRVLNEAESPGVTVLLETTSGGTGCIGATFEQMRDIIAASKNDRALGLCFDTCHVFAAGYDIRTNETYEVVMRTLDSVCGLSRVKAFHLNDSKGELGSHKDRHEHIGKGKIGPNAFKLIMNDQRFLDVAKSIETPKGNGDDFDIMNLGTLVDMVNRRGRAEA